MDTGQQDERVAAAWRAHRPHLTDLAFRMLGDIGAAEDVVQDAFTRLIRTGPGEIDDERGWLIVVTSRLCLDQIRSARMCRERPRDASEIEFVLQHAATAGKAPGDPADRVTLDDSVRLALLVVLQRLSAAERVVFVLHDIFGVPFGTIAQTVGRPAATCRQLARRARQKISSAQGDAHFDVAPAEHRLVTDRFIAACAGGDLAGLLAVLGPDAWGDIDFGPGDPRVRGPVIGAEHVARNVLRFWGPPATLVSHPAGGTPALLGFIDRDLAGVLVLTMSAGKIQGIHVIGDPRALAFLSTQLG